VDGNQHHICTRIQRWRSYKILWWVTSRVSRRRMLSPEPWYSVRLVPSSCSVFAICRMICFSAHIAHCEVMGLLAPLYGVDKLPLYTCTEKKSLLPLCSFLPHLSKFKMRISLNYLKKGRRHVVLDALWSHTKLCLIKHFFFPRNISPWSPKITPHCNARW